VATNPMRAAENSEEFFRPTRCGHARAGSRGPAGLCERCRLNAQLTKHLREAAKISEKLDLEILRQQLVALAKAPR